VLLNKKQYVSTECVLLRGRRNSKCKLYTNKSVDTLQRHDAENSKQIFPEKELGDLSPNFHIHVSVSGLYVYPLIGLPILLQENMWTDPGNI
jgi:hypothetical protein